MNFYILSVIIFSILLIPVSFATAAEVLPDIEFSDAIFSSETPDSYSGIYIFVQVIQRDSNGNIVSFFQSDKMTDLNPNTLNYYVNSRAQMMDIPVYNFGGQLVQAYGEKFTVTQEIKDITASTLLVVEVYDENSNDVKRQLAARFAHDGIVMEPGDVMETHWFIARVLN
jgi:hypothetical protein